MRIQRVVLENCRRFEHVEIDLDRPFTLLAGTNGSGKTTVLDALAHALRLSNGAHVHPTPSQLTRRVRRYVVDRIDEIEQATSIELMIDAGTGTPLTIKIPAAWPGSAWSGGRPFVASLDASRSAGFATMANRPPEPLSTSWAELSKWTAAKTQVALERSRAASSRGEPLRPIHELVPELAATTTAVTAAISEATAFEYSFERGGLFVTLADGQLLSPTELSDGYRTLLGHIAEIARRMVEARPDLGARAPLETEGVILIDELEAHLHPKWQRSIVGGLRKAFPKVQFVCATHSPQILAEAPPGSVVLLHGDGRVEYPASTFGRDANAILREVMGTTERPVELAAEFATLRAAMDAGDIERARKTLDVLEARLGSDVDEVIEARWALKAEEALGPGTAA